MKKLNVVRLACLFALTLATFTLPGCGGSVEGLATDSGTMTMEEFQRLKEEEEKATADAMTKEFKK